MPQIALLHQAIYNVNQVLVEFEIYAMRELRQSLQTDRQYFAVRCLLENTEVYRKNDTRYFRQNFLLGLLVLLGLSLHHLLFDLLQFLILLSLPLAQSENTLLVAHQFFLLRLLIALLVQIHVLDAKSEKYRDHLYVNGVPSEFYVLIQTPNDL